MEKPEDLYQIALLIDQLKHDDVQFRVNASKSIIQIGEIADSIPYISIPLNTMYTITARALGSERTRDELIPFLTESIDDEDDVIVIIAEKLGELSGYVGGKDHTHHLLAPLECLVSGEESPVRDKALKSIETVIEGMSNEHVVLFFVPLLIKLANRDWYTSRASAAALFHVAYKAVPDKTKRELENEFLRLCMDETPTVRRVASQHLVNMLKLVKSPDSLMDVVKNFARDDQDSIRIQVIPICTALCGHSKSDSSQLLPTILLGM